MKIEQQVTSLQISQRLKFGHSFGSAELATLDIMQNHAINKEDFANETIKCKRCKTLCSFTNP